MINYTKFLEKARDIRKAKEVSSLVGKQSQYRAAREIGFLHTVSVHLQIHYQERDGSKNYHDCDVLDEYVSQYIKDNFKKILPDILGMMDKDLAKYLLLAEGEVLHAVEEVEKAKELLNESDIT